mgnify:CR=1 FL=1
MSHAAAKGILGGVDLDLQCGDQSAYTHLKEALHDGSIERSSLEEAATRVLSAKFALGLFESPYVNDTTGAAAILNAKSHQNLALRAAEEGIVMLKNKGNFLPLTPDQALRVGAYIQ